MSCNERGRFGALKSDSTHHIFRNACTKSGSLRFSVSRLLTDFVCLYTYKFWLSLCKIVRSSVILLLPLFSPYIEVSYSCVQMTKDGSANYIMVQSWLLFHYYVLWWLCMLSIIYILLRSSAFFNRIISMHTTTSVSRRLKILCIMFKIIAFFVITLFAWLYVSVGILLTMEGTCMAASFLSERRFGLTKLVKHR